MKKLVPLVALLAALAAPPAHATGYPTELAIGPTLGIAGPGLAWRQFALPWLGFQVGANSWGIAHTVGGALILSPYHDELGQRLYLHGGGAMGPSSLGTSAPMFYPGFGVGASKPVGTNWTFFIDVSYFSLPTILINKAVTIPFINPQLGFLYTF